MGEKNGDEKLARAYYERNRAALEWKSRGGKVVGCLGNDVPEEILIAAGYLPVRVCGEPGGNEEPADRFIERAFDPLVRSQFRRIVDGSYSFLDHIIINNSSDALVRVFYYLRELRRVESWLPVPELYFFDFLHTRYRTSALYNRERLLELKNIVEQWCGKPITAEEIVKAIIICNENRRLLQELAVLRSSKRTLVSGVEALQIIGASMFLPREEHSALLEDYLQEAKKRTPLPGVPLFITGSAQDNPNFYELVESCNAVIVGEDHDWGNRHFEGEIDTKADWHDALIDRYHLRQPAINQSTVSERVTALVEQVRTSGAGGVIFFILELDDAPSWDFPEQRRALEKMGVPVLLLEHQPYGMKDVHKLRHEIETFVDAINSGKPFPQAEQADEKKEKALVDQQPTASSGMRSSPSRGVASVKRLRSAVEANAFQREWFMRTSERVRNGEPFAIVNADVPQEIFRAMDLPYVVNQWWAAVCSAKQLSPHYFGLMNERGYRKNLCRYCSLSFASAIDPETEKAPWGGLPKPTLAVTRLTCDAQAKIFELWSREFGIPYYPLENTIPQFVPERWWEKAPRQWEDLFEPHRLDLMVEELQGLIRFLETTTGSTFSETKFKRVMELVNEQEEYNRLTRDLIAETVPAPVSITDQVPSVMIPQWHRGTEWGVKAARMFYEEVKDLVDRKAAPCQTERVRLMWLGTGLWFNLGFYQHFEQRYGATFVWSIYLGLAADAYARYGGEPLRALASRFVGMEDMLHMPPWNSDWYLKEAKKNGINGMVHLVAESCTQAVQGSYFIKKAFEDAGIPVLELRADTVDARVWNDARMTAEIETFLENRLGVDAR
ncbi:MAG: 2-hydroxyacyl-CoA dehydratase family protein [Bacillota bacterium]|nr:2-hydroxyacyl-CoA dehydratase family protein [Bacillota bacterium]